MPVPSGVLNSGRIGQEQLRAKVTYVDYFYCRPLPDDGSGIPRYGKQPVGRNKLSQIIPQMCKEAGIEGRKTGHSGKVTCATTLYRQDFSDQLIKERTGHRSLEALHKYKRTGPDQQYKVSMALLPQIEGKEIEQETVTVVYGS